MSSSPVTNDEECSGRRGMAKGLTQGEGGREAKWSRVRSTATATGEGARRGGEESKEKGTSDVRARLGSKAPALAWLLGALAYPKFKPGREPPKPRAKPKPGA